MLRLTPVIAALVLMCSSFASAEMQWADGRTSAFQLPKEHFSERSAMLKVPHKQQLPFLCVPTSVSMVLQYYGNSVDPRKIKEAAEAHKFSLFRNKEFTLWDDVITGLNQLGFNDWRIENFSNDRSGFDEGLRRIRNLIRDGRPAIVDVHLGPGHTFVIAGFDDDNEILIIQDPDYDSLNFRKLSCRQFERDWHNHQFSNSRSVLYGPAPKI